MLPTFKRKKVLHEEAENRDRSVAEVAVSSESGYKSRNYRPTMQPKTGPNRPFLG